MATPVLYIVIPCYNEESVLPITCKMFLAKLNSLISGGLIGANSRIMFVDDGSKDGTWPIIEQLAAQDEHYTGLKLSRNRGHQNALLAGLETARDLCDVTISIDCDGQDDIDAMDRFIAEYASGSEVVYGVRSSRASDTFFKRATAQGFYKIMNGLGANVIYNHADYRLMSKKALIAFSQFKERNLFLRGMVPLIGFKFSVVEYERSERLAGESKYPLRKMVALAMNGITSLSVGPLRLITSFGLFLSAVAFIATICVMAAKLIFGNGVWTTADGWTSLVCIIVFLAGIQLLCVGVIGEYIGKIYTEVKQRPRYTIEKSTQDKQD